MILEICVVIYCLPLYSYSTQKNEFRRDLVEEQVAKWSSQIETQLYELSSTMTRKKKVAQSLSPLKDKIFKENGQILVQDIAKNLWDVMEKKQETVKEIAEYAEFLSYHRNNYTETDYYYYYDADNITDTNTSRIEQFRNNIKNDECEWWCYQKNLTSDDYRLSFQRWEKLFKVNDTTCDCPGRGRIRSDAYYLSLPMYHNQDFNTKVSFDSSVIKRATNLYHRDENLLKAIKWTEALDLVFKKNALKDPTLKYQYFASPIGFMRHYPGVKWSEEKYDRTYDPRTRSWYTEAMTSPKDIIILIDSSGSMSGIKKQLSDHIVNNILDTLNDNDFVNIYLVSNVTKPLIICFNNTLVQANEENLRLLRENLTGYVPDEVGKITDGIEIAFQQLEQFRGTNTSSQCNQAIMIITEGVGGDYGQKLYERFNSGRNKSVRIFTFLMGTDKTDAERMETIACNNRGYYVNISWPQEVREKVLNYLNVMSRPINYQIYNRQEIIWSYLYVDIADRRFSNWMWKKFEGIRQREVFLDHAKREFQRLGRVFTSSKHMLLMESHDYEQYKERINYDYMTTVSMPVYGRRNDEYDLIGVAGVDVPIKLLKAQVEHHKLGVNGYAFIVTNNGYILMHPGHRREFQNILKPTFNRVDLLEEEILADNTEPRIFDEPIKRLRENIIENRKTDNMKLKVKFAIDDMKRVILSSRHYFNAKLGPFRLGIAVPEHYGYMVINNTESYERYFREILTDSTHWKVHPEWVYCEICEGPTPEQKIVNCRDSRYCKRKSLMALLIFDAYNTNWFQDNINSQSYYKKKFAVHKVFVATHSGLTRWKTFSTNYDKEEFFFENKFPRAIDEDYYKRAVEDNYNDEDKFIYSVPFEISGFEGNTLVTSISSVFVKNYQDKIPVAVVGLQFSHTAFRKAFEEITDQCEELNLMCLIVDNNAYIILSSEFEHTGRYVGNINPHIMYHLVNNHVYKPTRMFDYQAICQEDEKKVHGKSSSSRVILRLFKILDNIWQIFKWMLITLLSFVEMVGGANKKHYQSIKNDTLIFERMMLKKTVPTPCDHEMWLFTLYDDFTFNSSKSQSDCSWTYIAKRIPKSNLIFLAINKFCRHTKRYPYTPTPQKIIYNNNENESLPCVIVKDNTFSRIAYMKCYATDINEEHLNDDRSNCGRTWNVTY